ncbi:hypothetical protein O6H91_05G005900 [Diphasiastrum complanatum]|uniref:Uncharacterized protein n=1 Tax=Diphasiastrum complanatum TaxID=34168 RepID=A0ACC2DKL5_DIPCM|nr:hypothetical protein O6H91_05G005900 [Diphasiastrum complanatum]
MADPSLQTPLLQHSELLSCVGLGSDIQTHLHILVPQAIDKTVAPEKARSCKNNNIERHQNLRCSTVSDWKQKEILNAHPSRRDGHSFGGQNRADSYLELQKEFSIVTVVKLSMSFFFIYSAMNALSGYVTSVLPDELGDESLLMMQSTLGIAALAAPMIVAKLGELRGMIIGGMAHVVYLAALIQPGRRWMVLTASAVCGFGASLTWVAHGTFLTRCSPANKRGFFAGVFWGIYYLAGIAGNLASFLVFGRLSDGGMFAVGAASATIGVILLCFIKDPPRRSEAQTLQGEEKTSQSFYLRSLLLLFLLLPITVYSGSAPAFRNAEFTKLLPTHAIGAVQLFTGLGQATSSFFLSWLSDLIHYSTPTFLIGVVCSAIGLMVCPTLPDSSPTPSATIAQKSGDWPLIFDIPLLAFVGGLSFGIAEGVITSHLFAMFGNSFKNYGPLAWAIFNLLNNAGAVATYWMGLLLPMLSQGMYAQLWAQAILLCTGAPLYMIVDICSLHRLPFKIPSLA